jgi:hypothetical protein
MEVIMSAESIEEYEKMWAEDSKIDEANLIREASRIPVLHSKYYKLYHRAALKATKLRYELKELEGKKQDWMEGLMDQQDLAKLGWRPYGPKPMKSEIPRKIETDPDIVKLSLKIEYQSSIAKFLEDVVKQINQRNFVIRVMVDLMKFQSGAN